MAEDEKQTCVDCVFYIKREGFRQESAEYTKHWQGYCKRYPEPIETMVKEWNFHNEPNLWDWCGEFKERIKK